MGDCHVTLFAALVHRRRWKERAMAETQQFILMPRRGLRDSVMLDPLLRPDDQPKPLVAMAVARDEPRHRAGHLDHRVVGGRRAVHEDVEPAAEIGERHAEPLAELRQAVHDAGRLVVERRGRLVEDDLAVGCHADDVGERPPDIDTNSVTGIHGRTRCARRSGRGMGVSTVACSLRSPL